MTAFGRFFSAMMISAAGANSGSAAGAEIFQEHWDGMRGGGAGIKMGRGPPLVGTAELVAVADERGAAAGVEAVEHAGEAAAAFVVLRKHLELGALILDV